MQIRRTANAGILLMLDGKTVLLDGVCREEYPYPATPPLARAALSESWPDVIAFTHMHNDHYDPDFAADYKKQTNGVILGPESLPGATAEPVPPPKDAVINRSFTPSRAALIASKSSCAARSANEMSPPAPIERVIDLPIKIFSAAKEASIDFASVFTARHEPPHSAPHKYSREFTPPPPIPAAFMKLPKLDIP